MGGSHTICPLRKIGMANPLQRASVVSFKTAALKAFNIFNAVGPGSFIKGPAILFVQKRNRTALQEPDEAPEPNLPYL